MKRRAPSTNGNVGTALPLGDKGPPNAVRGKAGSIADIKPEPWGKGTEHDSERVDEIAYGLPRRRRQTDE